MKKIIVKNAIEDITEGEDGQVLDITYCSNSPVFVPIETGLNINVALTRYMGRPINTREDIYMEFPYNFKSLDTLYKDFPNFAGIKPTLTEPQTEKIRKLVLNCGYLPTKQIMGKLKDHYTILSTPLVLLYVLQLHTPQTKSKLGEKFFIPEAGWDEISDYYADLRKSLHNEFKESNINISLNLLELLISRVNNFYYNKFEHENENNNEGYEPIDPKNIDEFLEQLKVASNLYTDDRNIYARFYQILTGEDPKEIFSFEYWEEKDTINF